MAREETNSEEKMRIWKTSLAVTDRQIVGVPQGAKFLTVQVQRGSPQLWFLCDEKEQLVSKRTIAIYGTGNPIPDDPGEYISTFQELGGELVWHVFEI
jgi:hypothetical protein